jgi:hypothetical protein
MLHSQGSSWRGVKVLLEKTKKTVNSLWVLVQGSMKANCLMKYSERMSYL